PRAGQRYGRWTVLSEAADPDGRWLCRCDCGTQRTVADRSLRYGLSASCGCGPRDTAAKARAHDLSGQTFGRLTALGPSARKHKNGVWWQCRCACGSTCEVSATLLVNGRRTHCGGPAHACERAYAYRDITGQRFGALVALHPLEGRSPRGSVLWRCRCDCGTEVDCSYNDLAYANQKSCGCLQRAHKASLYQSLTHVDGTSLDMLKSDRLPANNTTGVRGVYLIRGRYVARLVFQHRAYRLGSYPDLASAAAARRRAEEQVYGSTVAYYARWKARADADPAWAAANPIRIQVQQGSEHDLCVTFSPAL
ncbi:MAG: hypothetical protein IJ484_06790, partial [Oscillospiraceae bacterium]|nr:hypothetical protein [Oscillospiraceae bacterium]